MDALWLDYRRTRQRSPLPGIALLAVALACAGWLLNEFQTLQETVEAAEHRVAVLKRAADRRLTKERTEPPQANPVTKPSRPSPQEWARLLDGIEAPIDETVTLLSLEPNEREREVSLTGEAKDFAALAAFVKRLEEGAVLKNVRLLSHDIVREHPQKPVRFALVAVWSKPS